MLLVVDAGNTNVVFALLDAGTIRARWRIATDPRRTADEYAVWLNQLLMLEGFGIADVDADGTVVAQDLALLLADWGRPPSPGPCWWGSELGARRVRLLPTRRSAKWR